MGKFDNVIIASDIDGTFLGKNYAIIPRNIEKIKYFVKNGGHFTFSSGRASFDVGLCIPEIENLVNIPLILCNGSYLYDMQKKTTENIFRIDNGITKKLLGELYKKFPDAVYRITAEKGLITTNVEKTMQYLLPKWQPFVIYCPVEDLDDGIWYKIVFTDSPERIKELEAFCKEKYPAEFSYTKSSEHLLELCPVGVSKALQLEYLKNKMQKDYPDVKLYCIGDYLNDYEMLSFADVAVCPSNALDSIKAICDIQVCSNNEGALADLIERIEQDN